MALGIYEIDIFSETFFLLNNRMFIAIKLFRVVTCCIDLSDDDMALG